MPNWTQEQSDAIRIRDKNLLVSAAAGSGKTAVLVERIIKMILDEDNPIDIDRIVVVTFTNAAAAQMKEKIYNRISRALEENPDNIRLQKTLPLVHKATITTIDSFCLDIVRNNFSYIDIDPSFRIADEGEIAMLKSDTIKEVLESCYAKGETSFIKCVECFGAGKDDRKLGELILDIYRVADSFPWPIEWLDSCKEIYGMETEEELLQSEFIKLAVNDITDMVNAIYDKVVAGYQHYAIDTNVKNDKIRLAFTQIKEQCDVLKAGKYELFYDAVNSPIVTVSGKPTAENEQYRATLKEIKEVLKIIKTAYCTKTVSDILAENLVCKDYIDTLIELVKTFSQEFQIVKRAKNVIDFADMEHMALDILVTNRQGELEYTKVADELSSFYEEIFVDEYQDSNEVQEQIIKAISKERFENEKNNVFMVGDVKQSIYRFRMACPEIFVGKYDIYDNYREGMDSSQVKIELRKNFRSREHILESVNDIFLDIMKKPVGNVEYNHNVKLNVGRDENGFDYNEKFATEIYVLNKATSEEEDEAEDASVNETFSDAQREANVIAKSIKDMMADEEFKIYDDELDVYRNAKYKDFVVLLRSAKVTADTMVLALQANGIPAIYNSDTGYFDSMEIKEVLNYLAIIDNPRQDIPLYGSMVSYFGGFDDNEIAIIKANGDKEYVQLYDAFLQYCEQGTEETIKNKCQQFAQKLAGMRKKASYMKVSDIVWEIVFEKGYYEYIGMCSNAKVRKANLDIFIEKAKNYEKTSYVGLFNFLRYIEKLKKFDVDYGNATIIGKQEDFVRITTIHKSKGLEYPVVFVAGMGKKWNQGDFKKSVFCDQQLKMAMDAVRLDKRTRRETFFKQMIKQKQKTELIGEELRVLYVALTRAREKLILVGSVSDYSKKRENYENDLESAYSKLKIMNCGSFMDMFMPVAIRNGSGYFKIIEVEQVEVAQGGLDKNRSIERKEYIPYVYEGEAETEIPSKFSVSDIKHERMETVSKMVFEEKKKPVPEFISNVKNEKSSPGALRGNAYHKVMEMLDYSNVSSLENIEKQLENFDIGNKEMVNSKKIYNFCNADIGQRIGKAAARGQLYREQQFVFGVAARELDEKYNSDELVLVQGIIDMYWIEDDKVFLLDYKTDAIVNEGCGREELIGKYEAQLKQYQYAIEHVTKMEVAQMYIYSFALEEYIRL